jgi:hypothetical protein
VAIKPYAQWLFNITAGFRPFQGLRHDPQENPVEIGARKPAASGGVLG